MHSDNNDFKKLLNMVNMGKDTNIFFSFANKCFHNIKEIKSYNFLDFYNRMTKVVYGKSLFENNFIKELIFKCIYLKSKGINFELPENFDTNDFSQNLKPYEIEFLNFILTEFFQLGGVTESSQLDGVTESFQLGEEQNNIFEQNKSKISDWYKNVSQKEKVTYVEKTFLLQINGEINFFDLNFSQNADIDIYDNEELSKVNLCKLLNDHFQSGADSRLMNNPNNFLSLYNKIIDIFSKDKIVIEKQDGKIVEIKITKKIKQDLIYRMFELFSGSEYYTIKKNGDSYYLFKCRGKGEFLSELEFGDIVRQGNRPSFFAHIFELKKENRDKAVRFLLEQLNEMLKDKSIDKIDKASILLPFFINENISGIRVNLYDKLLSEYKNNKEINSLIKNIFKRSKEYFPEGYLKKYLIQKEVMKKVAKAAVKLVKASEEKERKKVEKVMKKVVKATVKSAAEEKVEQAEEEVQKVEKQMILRAQELKKALEKEAAAVAETLEALKRSVEVAEELKKALEKKEAAKKVAEAVKEVARVVKEAVKTTVKEEVKQIIEEARKKAEEEATRKAEEERKKAEEEKKKAEKERLEKERLEKEKEEKEKAVAEEARKKAEEEAARKAEEERKKAEKERLEKEKEEKEKVVEEFLESIPKKPETNSVNNTQSVNRTPGKPTQEKPSTSEKPVNTSRKVAELTRFFEEEAVKFK